MQGATIVFDVTNLGYVPSSVSFLKYTTVAYSLTDTSQNPCTLADKPRPVLLRIHFFFLT